MLSEIKCVIYYVRRLHYIIYHLARLRLLEILSLASECYRLDAVILSSDELYEIILTALALSISDLWAFLTCSLSINVMTVVRTIDGRPSHPVSLVFTSFVLTSYPTYWSCVHVGKTLGSVCPLFARNQPILLSRHFAVLMRYVRSCSFKNVRRGIGLAERLTQIAG